MFYFYFHCFLLLRLFNNNVEMVGGCEGIALKTHGSLPSLDGSTPSLSLTHTQPHTQPRTHAHTTIPILIVNSFLPENLAQISQQHQFSQK